MTKESINAAIDKAAEHIAQAKLVLDRMAGELNRSGAEMPGLTAPVEDHAAFNQSFALLLRLDNKCGEMQRALAKHQLRCHARNIKKAKRAKAARA